MSRLEVGGGSVVVVCLLSVRLLACTGTEHGNPGAPEPDGGGPPSHRPDGGPGVDVLGGSCELELWLRPDAERIRYRCGSEGDGDFSSETSREWRCQCGEDEVTRPLRPDDDAVEEVCEQLLAEACDVDLEQRNFCEHAGGTCWPSAAGDDRWDCACGDTAEVGPFVVVQADSCEAAAFARCATECEDPTGQCTPSAEVDRFDCDCDYFGARHTPAQRCELALAGCNPQLDDSRDAAGLACSGFAGFCDEASGELRCSCEDGTAHQRPLGDLDEHSAEACSGELQALCGNGRAQGDAFRCSLEKEGGRTCSAGLRFADGRYDCHCESLNACNEEYDTQESEREAATCEAALAACSAQDDALDHPEAPECTADPGPRTCDGPASAGRRCNTYLVTEGRYHCQCYLVDGITEVDIRDQDVEANDCDAALDLCVTLDEQP